jgi:type VI secretion system protein ImpG
MDARLLRYYNEELRYLRELGGEFAREFPKVASRLGIEGLEVTDPYVERLLEGCAFLAARVQLKQDAEFPRLSHRLLELVYPNFLAPVPSMMVAQITPVADANLLKGPVVPRDTPMFGPRSAASDTRCEFRSGQDVQLTPLVTAAAAYVLNLADLGLSSLPASALAERPRCSLRITLQLPAGMSIDKLEVDSLRFFMGGAPEVAMQLHALVLSSLVGVLVAPPGRAGDGQRKFLPASALSPVGYADDEALLPVTLRGFSGFRVLQEYFAFPERFLFFDISGLRPVLAAIPGQAVEITLLLSRLGNGLDGVVKVDNFALNCVPLINLFPKRADRIQIDEGHHEFHVVPDRTAPLDFEVYDVAGMTGYDDVGNERRFVPLYAPDHRASARDPAFYTIWREPRLMSDQARREGPRSGYIGSEVFVSLVDPSEAPFAASLRQLAVQTRCTNRDLPVFLPGQASSGSYTLDAGLPLVSVKAVAGPSRPYTALREGGVAWRLLNLLSLNYLSLLDVDNGQAAALLRDLLSRFPQGSEPAVRRQIEALQQVAARPVVRRHPVKGPIAFGRGVEVRLTVDELGHAGGSAFLFGAAMHHYLSRHVSMNSFVETVLLSQTRGEVARWKPGRGARPVL